MGMYEYRVTETSADEDADQLIAAGSASGASAEKAIAHALRSVADRLDPPNVKQPASRPQAARFKDNGEKAGKEFMRDVLAGKRKMSDFGSFLADFIKSEAIREMPEATEAEIEEAMREGGLLK